MWAEDRTFWQSPLHSRGSGGLRRSACRFPKRKDTALSSARNSRCSEARLVKTRSARRPTPVDRTGAFIRHYRRTYGWLNRERSSSSATDHAASVAGAPRVAYSVSALESLLLKADEARRGGIRRCRPDRPMSAGVASWACCSFSRWPLPRAGSRTGSRPQWGWADDVSPDALMSQEGFADRIGMHRAQYSIVERGEGMSDCRR